MTRYVVIDVGCIACGEDTSVVGIFDAREAALARLTEYAEEKDARVGVDGFSYFPGGQHHVHIYEAA